MTYDELYEMARQQMVLSFLVHAGAKVGKTTLASTCPKPLLLLDAEGGSKFLNNPKIFWDPRTQSPPVWDGTWEICVVVVHQFEVLATVHQWLNTGQHHFRSLCVDSITEVQRRCKKTIGSPENFRTQDWGTLLMRMDDIIRDMRDLTLHPINPINVSMFIAETRESNGKWRPYMQGAIATQLPYMVDVLGYLYVAELPDPLDPTVFHKERQLLASPHPQFEAGERVQGRLGDVVRQPDVEAMLTTVYPRQGAVQ